MNKLREILPNIYGVKVPSEIELFHIRWLDNQILGYKKDYVFWESDIFLDGNWKILGTLTKDEISFDASEYVESTEIDIEQYDGILVATPRFWDYELESFSCSSSDDSFRSALPEEIYFENTFEEPESLKGYYETDSEGMKQESILRKQYKTAQENITEKLLILQKL